MEPPFCFCILFLCWHLLICENTLIQVVKLKKKRKRFMSLLGPEPARRRHKLALSPLGHERVLLSEVLILLHVLISFFRDKLPINMKMLVFFLAKCVRKKLWLWPKSIRSAIFGVETAAKCCELKRCAD